MLAFYAAIARVWAWYCAFPPILSVGVHSVARQWSILQLSMSIGAIK